MKIFTPKVLLSSLLCASLAFAVPAYADKYGEGEHADKAKKHMKHKHKKRMEQLDVNKDGVITREEFLSHAEERFNHMDANSDGGITKDEAKAFHEAMKEKRRAKREERKNLDTGDSE